MKELKILWEKTKTMLLSRRNQQLVVFLIVYFIAQYVFGVELDTEAWGVDEGTVNIAVPWITILIGVLMQTIRPSTNSDHVSPSDLLIDNFLNK